MTLAFALKALFAFCLLGLGFVVCKILREFLADAQTARDCEHELSNGFGDLPAVPSVSDPIHSADLTEGAQRNHG